jgi:nitrite reductase (NO-forming)
MDQPMMPEEKNFSGEKNTKIIAIIVAAAILVAGALYFTKKPSQSNSQTQSPSAVSNEPVDKTFDISSKPYEFSIKEIRVKKGEKVRINLTNELGLHDWVIDEFAARTKQIQAGQTDSVVFTADKIGTFEYYCSVGTHRQMGMVGKLIVE